MFAMKSGILFARTDYDIYAILYLSSVLKYVKHVLVFYLLYKFNFKNGKEYLYLYLHKFLKY